MEKYEVKCNNCNFIGCEEDLILSIEFKENFNSEVKYLNLDEFNSIYKDFNNVFESEVIKGCPNCLCDAYLMDIE